MAQPQYLGTYINKGGGASISITGITIDPTAQDRLLIVDIGTHENTPGNRVIGSVVFNNATVSNLALTKTVAPPADAGAGHVEQWYILNPPATPSGQGTIIVNGNQFAEKLVSARLYANIQQVAPNATGAASGNSATGSVPITPTVANSILLSSWMTGPTISSFGTAGDENSRVNQVLQSYENQGASDKLLVTPAATTMRANLGSGNDWNGIASAFSPGPDHKVVTGQSQAQIVNTTKTGRSQAFVNQTSQKSGMSQAFIRQNVAGKLARLPKRIIDNMKWTKDWLTVGFTDAQYQALVDAYVTYFDLTHAAISCFVDPQMFLDAYPAYRDSIQPRSLLATYQLICGKFHAKGLRVLHRMEMSYMSSSGSMGLHVGSGAYPQGTLADIFPVATVDLFSRTTFGPSYITTVVASGVWDINNGQPRLTNRGNLFTYNMARTAANFADGEFTVPVEKKAPGIKSGLIIAGGGTSVTPFFRGYVASISGNGTVMLEDLARIQDNPRVPLATDSSLTFLTGHFYNIKMNQTAGTLKIRVWEVGTTEPGTWLITYGPTAYASGFVGMTAEGAEGTINTTSFGALSISPAQNKNNYLGITLDFMVNNATTCFANGDIVAAYPERDECVNFNSYCYYNSAASWIQHAGGDNRPFVQFFNDLKDVEDYALTLMPNGSNQLITGYSTRNMSFLESQDDVNKTFQDGDTTDSKGLKLSDKAGVVVVDWYGTEYTPHKYNPNGLFHSPQEMYDSIRSLAIRYGRPVFLQEWSDIFWSDGVTWQSNILPQITPAARELYLRAMYDVFALLMQQGYLMGFNYWGGWAWAQSEHIFRDFSTGAKDTIGRGLSAAPILKPLYNGQILAEYFSGGPQPVRTGYSQAFIKAAAHQVTGYSQAFVSYPTPGQRGTTSEFPFNTDTFVNPLGTDTEDVILHHLQHTHANDSILELEKKVGIINSQDPNSLIFQQKVRAVNMGNLTGPVIFDFSVANYIFATLIGSINPTIPSGQNIGDLLILDLTNGTSSNVSITWPGNFKKGGSSLVIISGGGVENVIGMRWNGTNWVEAYRSLGAG